MPQKTVFTAINPYSGEAVATYAEMTATQVDQAIEGAGRAQRAWRGWSVEHRIDRLNNLSRLLRARRDLYAVRMAAEMGKIVREGRAELEKCARACDFYAEHGAPWLRCEPVATEARSSYIDYAPLGILLAVMPWNFPYWQVFRFGLPALLAGNAILLKHAPNVFGSALDLEALFRDADFPEDLVRALLIDTRQVPRVIADRRVAAVTVTGSVQAGRTIASLAGQALKSVMELGGSDPFVVLEDADLDQAAAAAVASRFQNCGQSCIAAKRLIVVDAVRPAFEQALTVRMRELRIGDPTREETDLGPMARSDLRKTLQGQVDDARRRGADVVLGGSMPEGPGFLYPPTLLTSVSPDSSACREEVFGPVAALISAGDEVEAVRLANDTVYGLAASVWTSDMDRGVRVGGQLESGAVFVNRAPFSDPRLPFGGIKASGYGRELSRFGLLEFCNLRSFWIDGA